MKQTNGNLERQTEILVNTGHRNTSKLTILLSAAGCFQPRSISGVALPVEWALESGTLSMHDSIQLESYVTLGSCAAMRNHVCHLLTARRTVLINVFVATRSALWVLLVTIIMVRVNIMNSVRKEERLKGKKKRSQTSDVRGVSWGGLIAM